MLKMKQNEEFPWVYGEIKFQTFGNIREDRYLNYETQEFASKQVSAWIYGAAVSALIFCSLLVSSM